MLPGIFVATSMFSGYLAKKRTGDEGNGALRLRSMNNSPAQ